MVGMWGFGVMLLIWFIRETFPDQANTAPFWPSLKPSLVCSRQQHEGRLAPTLGPQRSRDHRGVGITLQPHQEVVSGHGRGDLCQIFRG